MRTATIGLFLLVQLSLAGCSPKSESNTVSPGIKTSPGMKASPGMTSPIELDSQIYVADWANHRVVRFDDMSGTNWTRCGDQLKDDVAIEFPTGVGVDSVGRIYIAEQREAKIMRLAGSGDTTPDTFVFPNADALRVNKYAGSWIYVDGTGRIYLTFAGDHRIARIDDMKSKTWTIYGTEGRSGGQFRYPAGIWVDKTDRIYVADFDNFRIVRMDDMQGKNWTTLGGYGSGRFEFINPCGIWGDERGRVYIADQGNDRIVRIDDMNGENWTELGSFGTERRAGKLYAPSGICLDRMGRIYVTECSSNHRIIRMDDMTGANWVVFGAGGSGNGQFASPMGIFVR